MGKEKVTVNDLKVTLSELGVTSGLKQEKIIQRLQVNGCLIAMVTDVLDQLIKDEQGMFRLLSVRYKQEQKMHYTQMQDAAKKYYFHLKPFNKSFFGDEKICANLEDNANDIYEIIKLLADHTNDHKDMEAPWKFWQPRDIRTAKEFIKEWKTFENNNHNALDDALNQLRELKANLIER